MAVAKRAPRSQGAKKKQLDYMKGLNALPVSLSFMGGMAIGRFAINKLSKSKAVSGLMGAETKDVVVPLIVTGVGLMGPQLFSVKDKLAIAVCHGVAGGGADVTIQKLTGKSLVKTVSGMMGLGDTDDDEVPENTMQIAAIAPSNQELPEADIDVEKAINAEIEKDQESVKGLTDNVVINSDDLGDVDDDFDETEIEGVDDEENPYAGDFPQ